MDIWFVPKKGIKYELQFLLSGQGRFMATSLHRPLVLNTIGDL